MSMTIAEQIITTLADNHVKHIWGVVGDALNPVVDAIRREDRIEWVGVRHEEAGAFAASAQAQLTGDLAVCMGTVGPGAIHLLNGLYDAAKAHAPVLAIVGQVPTPDIGTDYFQEINNDRVFADVAVWTGTVSDPAQMPKVLETAVNTAISRRGVAVLSLPANLGDQEVPEDAESISIVPARAPSPASEAELRAAADAIDQAKKVTMLVGRGARGAREETLAVADTLRCPMVVTLQGKEGIEKDNPHQVGQTGLIGNPAAVKALEDCDLIFMVGTDFPYSEWIPTGKTVVQLDWEASHIGRRVAVEHAMVGHCAPSLTALLPLLKRRRDDSHLKACRKEYGIWRKAQDKLARPGFEDTLVGKVRSLGDNPDDKVRPEGVARALDEVCAHDAIFTSDTGMSTVWLSRLLPMTGDRRLIGSYNLGSMANAMPMALGAQALERNRQVVALCGDGGLMMLLGDMRTAVSYDLPITLVVFNNSKLGMVKLEQEQVGLPEYGTELDNPSFVEVGRALGYECMLVERPGQLVDALREAVSTPRPTLVEVITNPEEVAVPGKVTAGQALGFAKAKTRELLGR